MGALLGIIFLFSLVQSLFGMGLLLFGTPTLLLLGYDFSTTLSLLLPASLIISFLQRFSSSVQIDASLRNRFLVWCLPWVAATLALRLGLGPRLRLDAAVALFLFLAGFLRISRPLSAAFRAFVVRFETPFLILMGSVHGLTNMGGSFLSVFASTKYEGKAQVLGAISFCYLYFAAAQLLVLLVLETHLFGPEQLACILAAAAAYFLCGRVLFVRIPESRYRSAFTLFIFLYACLLLARHAGLL